MDFTPTEAQAAARELAAEIFEDLSTPERLRALDGDTDAELWKGLCAAGLVAAVEETGLLGLALMLEEQGRRTAQVPFAATCVYGLLPIGAYGTSEQRARWLPALRAGTAVATGAFPPPGRGPAVTASPAVRGPSRDAAAVTSAGAGEDDQEGEGGGGDWRLSGVVPVVPWLREATHVLVPARCATDGVVRCFLVETARTGVRVVPVETTAPWSAGRLRSGGRFRGGAGRGRAIGTACPAQFVRRGVPADARPCAHGIRRAPGRGLCGLTRPRGRTHL